MKKIVITGGAGFIGSNLIKYLIKKTKYDIISIDNYSSGAKKNHIINKRIKYIQGNTKDIFKILKEPKNIKSIFHFGEFSRIFQSFLHLKECIDSNSNGTNSVINFCMENKIHLIYSATSATIGNSGRDKNLSPYAFFKNKNIEFLENLKRWFKFNFDIVYFYNVYGPGQIKKGNMATVIGIFEEQFSKKQSLTVVKPGNQSRRFTHVNDTIKVCYEAWKKKGNRHYIISNKKSYTITQVAKMFSDKIKFLPHRAGERYVSSLSKKSLSNKIVRRFGKIDLKDYIQDFKKNTFNK